LKIKIKLIRRITQICLENELM